MKIEKHNIVLPNGTFTAELQIFEESDRKELYHLYIHWRTLSKKLASLGSRGVNLPEGLSEAAFCLEMQTARLTSSIPGANTSFDCYDLSNQSRIQVKACSVLPDLTSFGPKSVWDRIYFCDFYRDGNWDGTFDVYLIDNYDIYNHKVNANQTLKDQQLQGKRPRFSIYKEIIQAKNLSPIKTGKLSP
ncbi:MAG: Bsp6I family type II restriction endonuclease [Candidatus Omnitrophica bacterium]|nr:Bsp6I family type II restriction endonuclease [Candidatus Omnitrophota bacterium]